MKITIVAPRFPYPLDRGDRLTIYHLLKYLSQRHQVSLVCFNNDDLKPEWLERLQPFCELIATVPLNKKRAYANCLLGIPSRTPLQVRYHQDPQMKATVDQVIQDTKPDLLYGHYIRMGHYIESYRELPRVLAMQLSMTLNYRRLADHAGSWLHRTLYRVEHQKLRRFEASFARQFDKVLLISKHDMNAISPERPLNNVFFSPHGVDFEYFSPDPGAEREPNTLVFTGNMKYMPNVDAVLYFCQEILPRVRNAVPDVQLNIVGTNPLPEVQALGADPAIHVTGRVPDLRTYLNQAQVSIAPMRVAAGLLNKVLEGMSMQVPMVITSVANEGIRAENNKHLLMADTAQDFADKVIHLLNNPERCQALGLAARQFIKDEWSWEKHFFDLERMFSNLVETFPNRTTFSNEQNRRGWVMPQTTVVSEQ